MNALTVMARIWEMMCRKKTQNYLAVIFSWTSELQECQSHPNKMSLLFPQQNDIQFLSWGCRTFMKGNRKYREWEKKEKRRDIDKPILNSQCALLLWNICIILASVMLTVPNSEGKKNPLKSSAKPHPKIQSLKTFDLAFFFFLS